MISDRRVILRRIACSTAFALAVAAGPVASAEGDHRAGHKTSTTTVQRTLTVSVSGSGAVSGPGIACPGDCTQAFAHGTTVSLSATPGSGATFTGWSGA